MSQDSPQDNKPSKDSPSPKDGESSALSPSPDKQQLEQKIEDLIGVLSTKDLSPPQRERIVQTFREVFTTYIERGSSNKLDPELFKIAADTLYKDNENKFKYLTQKQTDASEENKREHELEVKRHEDLVKMLWPVLVAVIALVLGCVASGIYLAATGSETLGFSILSATISALFAYLGGLGTPYIFKQKD